MFRVRPCPAGMPFRLGEAAVSAPIPFRLQATRKRSSLRFLLMYSTVCLQAKEPLDLDGLDLAVQGADGAAYSTDVLPVKGPAWTSVPGGAIPRTIPLPVPTPSVCTVGRRAR